jgi:hypothetical protein
MKLTTGINHLEDIINAFKEFGLDSEWNFAINYGYNYKIIESILRNWDIFIENGFFDEVDIEISQKISSLSKKYRKSYSVKFMNDLNSNLTAYYPQEKVDKIVKKMRTTFTKSLKPDKFIEYLFGKWFLLYDNARFRNKGLQIISSHFADNREYLKFIEHLKDYHIEYGIRSIDIQQLKPYPVIYFKSMRETTLNKLILDFNYGTLELDPIDLLMNIETK